MLHGRDFTTFAKSLLGDCNFTNLVPSANSVEHINGGDRSKRKPNINKLIKGVRA